MEAAIAAARYEDGDPVLTFKLALWFFHEKPLELSPEEARRVPLLTRLACLAKGHLW